ncbi:uncharacterized protein TNCV_3524631 [Trichonephila clavipes]|uniref:Uncharacterized protein n=1 Tax=Trichonephila clavipes TaxID=2585209 RepID=A0A8X6V6F7_TRICX|nr:uncharacterized protein TNCV_3524631 [Trichonephila clavipes]
MQKSQEETKNELKEGMQKEPVLVSPVPVPASPISVKLSTYDGKTNWQVYKTQFCIFSEANGWNEGVKACQLAAVLRGEAAGNIADSCRHRATEFELPIQCSGSSVRPEILQGIRTSADENKTPQNRRKLAGICLRNGKARQLGFLRSPSNYALKLEAATQASCKDRHFIRGARVTEDEPCESRLLKDMEILKEEMQTIKAGISNNEKRNFRCWGCGGTGHLRRNFKEG